MTVKREFARALDLLRNTLLPLAAAINVGQALAQDSPGAPWVQSGKGAVSRDVQSTLRERISVKDFGATDDNSTNNVTAAQNTHAAAGGRAWLFPGTVQSAAYRFGGTLTTTGNLSVRGDGGTVSGVPRTWLKFSATPGSTGAHWNLAGADTSATIRDLYVSHVNSAATANGIGLKLGSSSTDASYGFFDRLWISGFDTCLQIDGPFLYGELRNFVAMDCKTYGVRVTDNHSSKYPTNLNGLRIEGGQFSRTNATGTKPGTSTGTGILLEKVGSSVYLRGTYRELNAVGLNATNFHILRDEGPYSENNGSYDVYIPGIYPFQTQNYSLVGGYFDALQASGLPRVRSNLTQIYAQGNKFYNDTRKPPFEFDSLAGMTFPSVFIGNSYRTRYLSNLSRDKGLVVIDSKHPLQLFSYGQPADMPVQAGTVFINTDPATMGSIFGWRVLTPGWLGGNSIGQTGATAAGSSVVTLNTATGWTVGEGSWITISGETFGGAPSAMVLYAEPGPKLYMSANADKGFPSGGRTVAYQTATLQTIYKNVTGQFKMDSAATKMVINAAALPTSSVQLTPTNAAAANLMAGSRSLYISFSSGTSFTVHTADGTNATGSETFNYAILN